MNIFVTSECPKESARNLCDKHVPKLVVENFQMLSCAVIRYGTPEELLPLTKSGKPAKGGYHKHPCSIWAGNTRKNFEWLGQHALETCKEYSFRFKKTHFCENGIKKLFSLKNRIPMGDLEPFAIAINDSMSCRQTPNFELLSAVEQYRLYYKLDKPFASWEKGRPAPDWFLK